MKQVNSFEFDVNAQAAATGFAAIAVALSNMWEKVKSFLTGNHGHSCIRADGTVHIIVSTSTEYTVEEAKLAAEVQRDSWDNLTKDMDQFCKATSSYAHCLLDVADECAERIPSIYDKICEQIDIVDEKQHDRSRAGMKKRDAECEADEAEREAKAAKAKAKAAKAAKADAE